jgi:general nucleoside transport system permease protein
MLADILQISIISSVFAAAIRISTPLLFAALGELVTERAGILNMGVEGMMLMSAFTGFMVSNQTGSLYLGIITAMFTGGLMGLIMAFMASTLKVEQIVTGMALNLLATGMSLFWYRLVYQSSDTAFPTSKIFQIVKIPLLSDIPILGPIFFSHKVLTYIAFLMVPAIWFFLYRTKYGLQIRCLGENPIAMDMKGVSVTRLQYLSVMFGGMMAGIGGAFLTLGSTVRFVPGISAGRGWLAIVIVIAGNWQPGRILLATFVFALIDAIQLQLQGIGANVPFQILLALPYVFAILVMMSNKARSKAPAALGIPYIRGEK